MADARIAQYTQALEFAERQVQALTEKHPDFFPIYTVGGKWHHAGELWTDWTGGFLAGMMWQFQRRTGSPDWRKRAEHYSKLLEHRQHDRKVHDLGFIFLNTYLPWYETSHDEHLHQVLVQAGRTLAMRFMEKGQYLQSFVAPESLFIDIMMNVPIIFYAARETGDKELLRVATAHCRTTRDTIVRADGSTAHEGIFDLQNGKFLRQTTHQGLRDDSAWARGLAWSLYGYSKVYGLTGSDEFLAVAERNAKYWLDHLAGRPCALLGFRRRSFAAAAVGRSKRNLRRRDRRQRFARLGEANQIAGTGQNVSRNGTGDARCPVRSGVSGHQDARLGRHFEARRLSHQEKPRCRRIGDVGRILSSSKR